MTNWTNTRVLILGAARQGLALARWLSLHGANVTLNDSRRDEDLASAKKSLSDVNLTWAAGGHPLELLDTTDVLCLSGGVLFYQKTSVLSSNTPCSARLILSRPQPF